MLPFTVSLQGLLPPAMNPTIHYYHRDCAQLRRVSRAAGYTLGSPLDSRCCGEHHHPNRDGKRKSPSVRPNFVSILATMTFCKCFSAFAIFSRSGVVRYVHDGKTSKDSRSWREERNATHRSLPTFWTAQSLIGSKFYAYDHDCHHRHRQSSSAFLPSLDSRTRLNFTKTCQRCPATVFTNQNKVPYDDTYVYMLG